MIFSGFKWVVNHVVYFTPNSLLPRSLSHLSDGRISYDIGAELYLTARMIFAGLLASLIPKSEVVAIAVALIQICSIVYLMRIVFMLNEIRIKDPGRSLFFAFGHYIELALSMGYIYWVHGGLHNADGSRQDAIYFSFVSMTTAGYGDIYPEHSLHAIVVCHLVTSIFMLATVIALFLSLTASNPGERSSGNQKGPDY